MSTYDVHNTHIPLEMRSVVVICEHSPLISFVIPIP